MPKINQKTLRPPQPQSHPPRRACPGPVCAFPRAIKWRKTETATPSEGSTYRSERRSERSVCVPERESVNRGLTKRRIQAGGAANSSPGEQARRGGHKCMKKAPGRKAGRQRMGRYQSFATSTVIPLASRSAITFRSAPSSVIRISRFPATAKLEKPPRPSLVWSATNSTWSA